MTDRELLELAAKAAGYRLEFLPDHDGNIRIHAWINEAYCIEWSPLTDDGDALRLARCIGLVVDTYRERAMSGRSFNLGSREWIYGDGDGGADPVCDSIVRAAAEIGRAMP
ncbi:hypothetical protein [Pseudomonas sp.]|uniref:hypothetical protein n=1 Tax=Pseudomonas sp. TaxID=306 RepID=UPI0025856735|nr:hypothetical protein [Pseudomonas sp.]